MTTVAQKNTYVKPPEIQELLEQHFGVKFPDTSSNRVMVLCPWHEDHSPSLSVDREQGLYHCFGCQKSGNAWTLVKESGQGLDINVKHLMPSVPPLSTRHYLFSTYVNKADEEAALEVLGYPERVDKLRSCGKPVAYRCTACGKIIPFRDHCHDRLCRYCRAALIQVFREKHEEAVLGSGARYAVEVATGWLPRERLKEGVPFLRDTFKKFRLGLTAQTTGVYGHRFEKAGDGRWRVHLLVLLADEKAALLWAMYVTRLGGIVLSVNVAQGVVEAWPKFIEWASQPYVGLTLAKDYEEVDRLMRRNRLVTGFGKLKPVTGGRLRGSSDKATTPHRCCPFCGAAGLKRLGEIDERDIVHHDGWDEWMPPVPLAQG